jgi:NAD+ diphosphatase
MSADDRRPGSAGSPFRDPALAGLAEARKLGAPAEEILQLDLRDHPEAEGFPLGSSRLAEVLMLLPRPGGLLFHTKAFYPPGILRLPTGVVGPDEPVLAAARREVLEETGLPLEPSRFLLHLAYRLQEGASARWFHSLAFLYPPSLEPMAPLDCEEEISEFAVLPWEDLPRIAAGLESVPPRWSLWGRFRAAPHLLLYRLRPEETGRG